MSEAGRPRPANCQPKICADVLVAELDRLAANGIPANAADYRA